MNKQIYNKILAHPLITLGIIQLLLILTVFSDFVCAPNAFMFMNKNDGLKNYFTFIQYILQEDSPFGLWHFTKMNYPFGEYIFFTDNTPGLALPLRIIHKNIISLDGNLIAIHNSFFLFNLLLTPILFYQLIRPFSKGLLGVALFCAIAVSWINPQLLKLHDGVYNLSLSCVLLLALIIMRNIYMLWQRYSRKALFKTSIQIVCLIFFSAFFHIYYIPILALAIGVFTLAIFVSSWIQSDRKYFIALISIAFSNAAGGFGFYTLILCLDKYAHLRSSTASGFNWSEWNFTPEAILTPRFFNTFYPIIQSCKSSGDISIESQGFWGNFVWFTLFTAFATLIYFLVRKRITIKQVLAKIYQNTFLFALLITMLITYAAAAGLYVKLCIIPLSFDNVFSPFFFLHDKIDLITQFRCLGRFSWMGFWIIQILSLVLFLKIFKVLRLKSKGVARIYAFALLFFLYWDTKEAMVYYHGDARTNLFQEELIQEKFAKLGKIKFQDYQAIYSIPAVQVGSENYDITIDDQKLWTEFWMQLSIHSQLPLFNCKMSRTALEQAQAQVDLLLNRSVPALIYKNVNDKPVLVVYSKEMEDNFDIGVLDYARPAAEQGSEIITAFKMDTLLELNNIYYLSWDIKNEY
jgi:hypothetical protein